MINNSNCPVCETELQQQITAWHFICRNCFYEYADLTPQINTEDNTLQLNEAEREIGLRNVRSENFKVLINKLLKFSKPNSSLLDVGAAHGWFLEESYKCFNVLGVEPDVNIYENTVKLNSNIKMRCGFFPDCLSHDENFNVITFNDVFEHIPSVNSLLANCRAHLTDNGTLLINLPSSQGFFYRVSKLFAKLGMMNSFERLWQKGMPSPHIHYFNLENLTSLLRKNNFSILESGNLTTVKLKGLYSRLNFDNRGSALKNYLFFIVILFIFPLLYVLPSDIAYIIARKDNSNKSE